MQFSRYIAFPHTGDLLKEDPGSHLLSHAVPSIVPSAAQGLTIVFGMGTGVSPGRIATGNHKVSLTVFHQPCHLGSAALHLDAGVRPMAARRSCPVCACTPAGPASIRMAH